MRHKNYFISLLAALLLLTCGLIASAQVAPLRGHVIMTQADGTKTPVEGAIIDVFRTDIIGKYETKTNKKGQFVFAGIPLGGTYTIAASAPNARPNFLQGVRSGMEVDFELVLTPGDGKRWTMEELKAAMASGGGGGGASPATRSESAADRAKRQEMERANAETAAQNQKNVDVNAVLNRTFKAGQESLTARRWDDAITNFKEGLAADPEQDALLVGLAEAYRLRGAERYNAAVKIKDNDAGRDAGIKSAQQDWRDAAQAANKAVEVVKKTTTPVIGAGPDAAAQARQNQKKLAALDMRARTMLLLVTKVDTTQVDAGLAAFQEYMAVEPDAAKKTKAHNELAKMLMDAGAADKALVEYRKILETNPDDVDALAGAGMALFNLGYAANDKTKFQEAANYLQRFVDNAPDTNSLKAEAKAVLEELKNQQVKPERNATPARRKRQ